MNIVMCMLPYRDARVQTRTRTYIHAHAKQEPALRPLHLHLTLRRRTTSRQQDRRRYLTAHHPSEENNPCSFLLLPLSPLLYSSLNGLFVMQAAQALNRGWLWHAYRHGLACSVCVCVHVRVCVCVCEYV